MVKKMERTFFVIKPSGTKEDKWLKILQIYLQVEGAKILCSKILCPIPRELAEKLYEGHRGMAHFEPLIDSLCCGVSIVGVIEGDGIIEKIRAINGATNPEIAAEGTIRRIFGINTRENAVHCSDSQISEARETPIFFPAL